MDRRTCLSTAGAALTLLAGCTGSSSNDGGGSGGENNPPAATATTSQTPAESPTPTANPTPTATPSPKPGSYNVDKVRSSAETVGYDTIFRNIEKYTGEAVYFEYGQVYQTIYEDNYTYLQLYVSNKNDEWEGDVAAAYFGDERILENDRIELWGVVEDLIEYETVKGNVRTIPLLTIVDYELYEN